MTYPASPNAANNPRGRPDAAQVWAGGVATAVVAALVALVGILICRWTLGIPILAPRSDGAWGSAHTGEYMLVAALAALVATGLLHLLMLTTPNPGMFFGWIVALATLAAVVYPFSTSAPLGQKAATAIVNLAIGIAITSLLTATAARAGRRAVPPPSGRPPYDRPAYDRPPYDRPPAPPPPRRPAYGNEPTEPLDPGSRMPGQRGWRSS